MDALTAHLASIRVDDDAPITYKRPRIRERKTQTVEGPVTLTPHLLSMYNPAIEKPPPFIPRMAPIANWRSYVRCLTMSEKGSPNYPRTLKMLKKQVLFQYKRDILKSVFAEWKQRAIENRTPPPELPKDLFEVEVKVKVKSPDGTTKFVVKAPYRELHEKYFSKGVPAPINKRVQAFALMGFPMTYLEEMLKHHDKMMKRKPKIDELIDKVFNKLKKKK
jgi:hypothetical protein